MRNVLMLCLLVGLAGALPVASRTFPVVGTVSEVTAYRGQALVTRDISAEVARGDQEIEVTGLPETVLSSSLYATAGPHITIRSVRYQITPLRTSPNVQVREIQQRIEKYQEQQRRLESNLKVLQARAAYLKRLETTLLAASGKSAEPSAVERNTRFLFTQSQEIAEKTLAQESRKDDIANELNYWQQRLDALRYGRAKSQREAVIYLGADRAGLARFTLSYLVNNVTWTPTYSAYLNGTHDNVTIEYVAVVTQRSGEDWPKVKLTLSTTRPTMIADASVLSPLWVNLAPDNAGRQAVDSLSGYNNSHNTASSELTGNDYTAYLDQRPEPAKAPQGPVGQVSQSTGMHNNVVAARMQNLELSAADSIVQAAGKMQAPISELLAVDYPLAERVAVPSRNLPQMFRVTRLYLPVKFYYTASPLLSDCVYQSADATNSTNYAMLPGPYTAYLDKQFAGRGQFPLVARGQNFTVGFGADTQLRVARELVNKTTEVKGGNNLATFNYTLKLLNFTANPVQVRVWDRIPRAHDDNVMIALGAVSPVLSTDAAYQADERPRGLLRWDVTVPPQTMGNNALKLGYTFTMEYDKSFIFTDLPAELIQLMRDEYQAMGERKHK